MAKVTKEELRNRAEELTLKYNEAFQEGDFKVSSQLSEEIAQAINEYTAIAREECFIALKGTDDPMLEAVKQLTFPSIKAKDTDLDINGVKIPVRKIEDCEKNIDLLKLHKYCGGIGKDEKWAYMVEKLNFLMTAQKAVDLGVPSDKLKTINDSYAMNDISKQIDMGKTPLSKTNILKTVQGIVTAMIGEGYKTTSHDVNFLMSIFSQKNRKALTVSCANHKYMRQYMMEICHRIVMDKTYEVEYRAKKS